MTCDRYLELVYIKYYNLFPCISANTCLREMVLSRPLSVPLYRSMRYSTLPKNLDFLAYRRAITPMAMAARPPTGAYTFVAAPVLEAFAEADALVAEAAVPVVIEAEFVALTVEETAVGVPDAAMEAADCLQCGISI